MENTEKNGVTITREDLIDLEWREFNRLHQEFMKAKSHRARLELTRTILVHARVLADLLKEYDKIEPQKKSLAQLLSRIPKKHHRVLRKLVKERLVQG